MSGWMLVSVALVVLLLGPHRGRRPPAEHGGRLGPPVSIGSADMPRDGAVAAVGPAAEPSGTSSADRREVRTLTSRTGGSVSGPRAGRRTAVDDGWRPDVRRRLAGAAGRRAAAGGLGIAVAVTLGGPVGIGLGVVAAVVGDRVVGRLEPADVRQRKQARAAELPLVLDLLGVCLRAGMPLVAALETVAAALPGPFSDDLRVVAGLQRLGATPTAAWRDLVDDVDLAPVARAVSRSAESGSRLAAAFDRLAADRRSALAAAGTARAQSAGVVAMAPLGLCFLPAFVCLGIVPVVLSLATEVLP